MRTWTADELERIADHMPERGNAARTDHLLYCAKRLTLAADSLVAEAAAISPATVGLVARVGKRALVAAGAVALAATGGLATGIGTELFDVFNARSERADQCLEVVLLEVPAAVSAIDEHVERELAAIRTTVDELMRHESGIGQHPALKRYADWRMRATGDSSADADRTQLANELTGALNSFSFALGYDDPDDDLLNRFHLMIEEAGGRINALWPVIRESEPED